MILIRTIDSIALIKTAKQHCRLTIADSSSLYIFCSSDILSLAAMNEDKCFFFCIFYSLACPFSKYSWGVKSFLSISKVFFCFVSLDMYSFGIDWWDYSSSTTMTMLLYVSHSLLLSPSNHSIRAVLYRNVSPKVHLFAKYWKFFFFFSECHF